MTTRNTNWDPNGEERPFCDDCGVLCDRGYSMRWSGDKVESVWCFECRDQRDLVEWKKTGWLNSHFMTTVVIHHARNTYKRRERRQRARQLPYAPGRRRCFQIPRPYEAPRRDVQRVEDAVRHFRATVWPIVHAQVNAERVYKGMSVERDGLKVLAFAMCGRIRIQVERDNAWCSAQGCEDDVALGIGLHGIGATAKEAVQLWKDAINLFKNGAKLVAAPGVGIL